MTTQHRPLSSPRHAKAGNRRIEQSLLALLVTATGIIIFRAILNATDDAMLALLGPVMVFLPVASLFAGDDRRRL